MSMVRCQQCERLVDSDDDPEVFGNAMLCKWCRDDPFLIDHIARLVQDVYQSTSELIKFRCDPKAAQIMAAEEGTLYACKARIDLILKEIRAEAEPKLRVVR